jgi:hypothetical protein
VRRVEHIRFALGQPRKGWLPFRISLGDFVVEDEASNVLNDPLAELIDWAVDLSASVSTPRRVFFWLEPSGYALDAMASDEPGLHILRVLLDGTVVPPRSRGEMRLQHEVLAEVSTIQSSLIAGLGALSRDADVTSLEKWFGLERAGPYLDRLARMRDAAAGKS